MIESIRVSSVVTAKGEDFRVLDSKDISTKTKSASDIAKRVSKADRLKNFYTEARRAFVSDIVEIEDFAKGQSRTDNANVMATMYKNKGAMIENIQMNRLYSPSGDVVDDRLLSSVAVCWKDDKVDGTIDRKSQELFELYLFHKHGYDRMSIEQNVRISLCQESPGRIPASSSRRSQRVPGSSEASDRKTDAGGLRTKRAERL